MAEPLGEAYVEVVAKVDKINAQLEDLRKHVGTTAKGIEDSFAKSRPTFDTRNIMSSLSGLVAGFAALSIMKKSFSDFLEQERASNRLALALRNAGVASRDLGATRKDMEDYSTALMHVTAFADEQITEVQAMLTAMTGLSGRAVRPLTEATLDLAAGLGMDAQSAALLISKTIEGSNALGRYGIQIKDATSKSERIATITDEVNRKFGGFARGELETAGGKVKQFSNSLNEMRENFGGVLAKGLAPILPGLTKFVDFIGKSIPSAILALQNYFAKLFTGVIEWALVVNAILPDKFKILSEKTEDFLKRSLARGLAIQANAKKEYDDIWNTPAPGAPAPQGGKAAGGVTLSADEKKQRLDAEQELMKARARLQEQSIDEDYAREKQAAENRLAVRMREIDDMKKLATEEKPVDSKALATLRLAAQADFEAQMKELTRKRVADQLAFESTYVNDTKAYQRGLIDQQVRNHSISVQDFKRYLDIQLELDARALEARNARIKKFNRDKAGAPGFTPLDEFDVGAFRKEGAKENTSQGDQYSEAKTQAFITKWRKDHKVIAEAFDDLTGDLTSSWSEALDGMIRGNMNFGEGVTAVWRGISNAVIAEIEKILAKMAAMALIKGFFSLFNINIPTAATGGSFLGTSSGVRRMATGGSFIVPPGFANDSFPLFVQSGERVTVTPSGRGTNDGQSFDSVVQMLRVINMNLAATRAQTIDGRVAVEVQGKTDGQDIYFTNKKAGRIYSRIR